ncbi:LacI family DNA-binding transcriptional regulator [Pseudomonas sp. NPDC089752]|uniref:LacI family DNA-binding transcriptional regulator n=1 Tax=Pseudomonas sp. NPDC089752 TaxID=3364472 RepID=UPI00382C78E7
MSEMPSNTNPNHSATVTLTDVARLAGVAPMTVSRYFNAPETVKESTRLKVQKAVSQTGYVHNRLAGALRSSKTRLVAVVLPMVTNPLFSDTFQAISATLSRSGYQVLLGVSGHHREQEQELLEFILSRRPDGIILTGTLHTPACRDRLRLAGIPVVETWDLSSEPIDMLVGFSHEKAGREVARTLLGQGYRRFGLLAVDDPRGLRRAESFTNTLAEHGVTEVSRHISAGAPSLAVGREGLSQLLQEQSLSQGEPLAVVCTSDTIAHGVLTEAIARGIAVPSQLSVMGFGDMNFAAHTYPSLSTVKVDGAQIGDLAARMMLARLQGELVEEPVKDVGFTVVQRESTAQSQPQK